MVKVVGIGNPLMGDDGFGLRVAEELQRRSAGAPSAGIISLPTPSPWDIYEVLREGDSFIVVDAMEEGEPGVIETFPLDSVRAAGNPFKTCHEININQVMDLLRLNGREVKGTVVATRGFAFGVSLELSPQMAALVVPAADKVSELLAHSR